MESINLFRPQLFALALLAGCFPSGQIDLQIAIANENDRAINVTAGDAQTTATVAEVALTLDNSFLEGSREVVVFNEKTLLNFGSEESINFPTESRIGSYSKVGLLFGSADSNIAGQVGDPLYEGACIRLAGTVDLDPAVAGEETSWSALIEAPLGRELQLFQDFKLTSGAQVTVTVGLDLRVLLGAVDFAALTPDAFGVLVIAPDDPNNFLVADELQNNIDGAFSIFE
jgi:hypothetical protein